MDRFIESRGPKFDLVNHDLKSNMDRFIDCKNWADKGREVI